MRRGPESGIYEAICDLLKANGFYYWRLSQARASKQSAGVADLFAVSARYRLCLWIETKSRRGHLTDDQEIFRAAVLAAGGSYCAPRSVDDLAAYLRARGVPVRVSA